MALRKLFVGQRAETSALYPGYTVPPFCDSLLGKLIVKTRPTVTPPRSGSLH